MESCSGDIIDENSTETLEDAMEYPEEGTDLFICLECNFRTNDNNDLAEHIRMEHERVATDAENDTEAAAAPTQYIFEDSYKCEMCEFESISREVVVDHINVTHMKTMNAPVFKCSYCSYQGTKKFNLQKHMRRQHPEYGDLDLPELSCDKCEYKAPSRKALKDHAKIHTEGQLYKCEECPYVGGKKANLQRHIKSKHRVQWYQCENCMYSTRQPLEMKKHKQMCPQTTDRMYKCKLCEYETSHRHLYKIHCYKPHPWYECQKCLYRTRIKSNLTTHVLTEHTDKIHVEFKCERCNHLATSREELQQHIIDSHTNCNGTRWYKCSNCVFKTVEKCLLKQHMYDVHQKESVKQLSCKVCGELFIDWVELRDHHLATHSDQWFQCHMCKLSTQQREAMEEHVLQQHVDTSVKAWYGCYKCKFYAQSRDIIDLHVREKHQLSDSKITFYEDDEELSDTNEQNGSECESENGVEESNYVQNTEEVTTDDIKDDNFAEEEEEQQMTPLGQPANMYLMNGHNVYGENVGSTLLEDNSLYITPEVEEVCQTQEMQSVHPNPEEINSYEHNLYLLHQVAEATTMANETKNREKMAELLQQESQHKVHEPNENVDIDLVEDDVASYITYEKAEECASDEYVIDNSAYISEHENKTDEEAEDIKNNEAENEVLIHIPEPEEPSYESDDTIVDDSNATATNEITSEAPETKEDVLETEIKTDAPIVLNGVSNTTLVNLDLDCYLEQKVWIGDNGKSSSFTIRKRPHLETSTELVNKSATSEENNNTNGVPPPVKKQKVIDSNIALETTEDASENFEDAKPNELTDISETLSVDHKEQDIASEDEVPVVDNVIESDNLSDENNTADDPVPMSNQAESLKPADSIDETLQSVIDSSRATSSTANLNEIDKTQIVSEIENVPQPVVLLTKEDINEKADTNISLEPSHHKLEDAEAERRFDSFQEFYAFVRRRFAFGTISLYQKKFSSKDGAKALMFANDGRIRNLINVKVMIVDTTFKIETDDNFRTKLLTVLVWAGDRFFPIMYALFNKKSNDIFKMMFAHLRDTLAPHIKPAEIIMSYEATLYFSLAETYPDALIGGSVFYFAQKLQQKLYTIDQKKNRVGNIRTIFSMLVMLPFLPQESFMSGLEYVESKAIQFKVMKKMQPLFDYIRSEWIGKVTLNLLSVYRNDCRLVANVEWPFRKLRGILNANKKTGPFFIMGVVESLFKLEMCMHQSTPDESLSAKREVVKAWLYLEKFSNTNINTFFSKVSQYMNCVEKQLRMWKVLETDQDEDELINAANFNC